MKLKICLLGLLMVTACWSALGDTVIIDEQTFHLVCTDATSCVQTDFPGGSSLRLADSTVPTFAMWRSPPPGTDNKLSQPDLWMAVFVPSQSPDLTFKISSDGGTPAPFSLFSTTPWAASNLWSYLGLTQAGGGGPNAPLDAFLVGSSTISPGTTGYEVYLAELGVVSFVGCTATSPCFGSGFVLSGTSGLPAGSVIYAYVRDTTGANTGKVTDATAPSSSIITPVPEPGSLVLLGTGLLGLVGMVRRKFSIK